MTKKSISAKNSNNGLLAAFQGPRRSLILLLMIAFVAFGFIVVMRSYAATNIAVGASTGSGVQIPSHGIYWGGTNAHDTVNLPGCSTGEDFAKLECKIQWAAKAQGIPVAADYHSTMAHTYSDCGNSFGAGTTASARASGRKVLMINMTCGDWGAMAAGNTALLDNVRARTRELAALNIPVILSYHHEPENDSCDAPAGHRVMGTPDQYRAATRKFVATMRAEAARVGSNKIATGMILMGFTYDRAGTEIFNGSCAGHTRSDLMMRNPDNWYAGDDASDWLLDDGYDNNGVRTFGQIMDPFNAWSNHCATNKPATNYLCTSAKANKPLAIAETGVNGTPAHRSAFFDNMRTVLSNYPKLKGYAYWSSAGSTGFNSIIDRQDDTQHLMLKSYTRIELDAYVHSLEFGLSPTPTPATPTPTPVPAVQHGLHAEYFGDKNLTLSRLTRTDNTVDFNWASGSPDPSMAADTFSARWTGSFTAPKVGPFTINTLTDDGVRLWIDGVQMINDWNDQGIAHGNNSFTISFPNTTTHHTIKMEYYQNLGLASAKLRWTPPGEGQVAIPVTSLFIQ